MTPAQLRARADQLDAEGERAGDAGDHRKAVALFYAAEWRRRVADEMEQGLTLKRPRRNVNSEQMLTAQHREALSKSRATKDKRFLAWIRKKGYTLNSLAEAVPMSAAAISQARLAKSADNHRPIRESRAARIQELTEWPATDWPEIIKG